MYIDWLPIEDNEISDRKITGTKIENISERNFEESGEINEAE